LNRFPSLGKHQLKVAKPLKRRIVKLEKKINFLRKEKLYGKYFDRQIGKLRELQGEYEGKYQDINNILPTEFGNVLKAAESYSLRYGIDGVPMWTRMIHVIPENYYRKLVDSHNQLSFLVNCSILALALTILSIFASLFQIRVTLETLGNSDIRLLYLLFAFFSIASSYIFYRASVQKVSHYGNLVRSSYDLFRMDLLKELRHQLPTDFLFERLTWEKLSNFMVAGTIKEYNYPMDFEYTYYDKDAKPEKPGEDAPE
jgi:hypothetical protein